MRFKSMEKLLFSMALFTFLVSEELRVKTGFTAHHKAQIAFTSTRDGNAEIYVMDADGKNQRRLTDSPRYDGHPSWSPDGQRIAFVSQRGGFRIQIYVMDSNGENQTRLTHDGGNKREPSWSPDGQSIAFMLNNFASIQIYVMDSDGKNRTRLTDGRHG